jgi:hypothetical protein
MKSHAATLALVGWYLMLPIAPDRYAPISEWAHVDSFDTAAECREEALQNIERVKKKGEKVEIDRAEAFECIATDDPRLKAK